MTAEQVLHGHFRSPAAYRVRIALNLKRLDYRHVGVHLLRDGGQQLSDAFGLIPQVFNALRFGMDMTTFPALQRIADTCNALPAFQQAEPAHQPDAE